LKKFPDYPISRRKTGRLYVWNKRVKDRKNTDLFLKALFITRRRRIHAAGEATSESFAVSHPDKLR
jgi:hypothetical protein